MRYALTAILVLLCVAPVSAGRVHTFEVLSLNGSGYAYRADDADLDLDTDDYMVECWFSTSTDANMSVCEKYVDPRWGMWTHGTLDVLGTNLRPGGTVYTAYSTAFAFYDGKKHCLAVVVDRSEATGIKLYYDGVEMSYGLQDDPSSKLGDTIDNIAPLAVGARYGEPYTSFLTGNIFQVRLWKFGVGGLPADIEAAIKEHAANPFALSDILTASDCKGWWKFAGGYTDSSGNSNTLTAGGSGNTFPTVKADRRKIWIK